MIRLQVPALNSRWVGNGNAVTLIRPMFVFIAFFLLIKYLETTWFGVVQYRLVGWDFFAHLMMVVMPVTVMLGARRSPWELGLSRAQFQDRNNRRLQWAAFGGIALFWALFTLLPAVSTGHHPALLLPPRFFADRMGLGGNLVGWLLTVVFTMVFCGVGEEVLFRGYLQGEFNRALGRPFRFRGVQFGPALILSAAIFGLGHGISFYNPFTDGAVVRLDWSDTAVTAGEGLLFGFLYEATGGIAAPAALHAAIGLFFGAIVMV